MTDIGPDLRTNRSGIKWSMDHESDLIPPKREKWKSQFDWTIMEAMADYNFIFVVKLSLGKIRTCLISGLIPKKNERFELWKNFVTISLTVQNWSEKGNFECFCPSKLLVAIREIMVTKCFQNSNFSGFLKILSEISH